MTTSDPSEGHRRQAEGGRRRCPSPLPQHQGAHTLCDSGGGWLLACASACTPGDEKASPASPRLQGLDRGKPRVRELLSGVLAQGEPFRSHPSPREDTMQLHGLTQRVTHTHTHTHTPTTLGNDGLH